MPSSSPPPDRFQREIDDIVRLAEKRLERQSPSYRARKATRRVTSRFSGFDLRLPSVEVMAGWGLGLLMLSFLGTLLLGRSQFAIVFFWAQAIGLGLLGLAIILNVTRRGGGGGTKTWRGEPVSYGSPYGDGLMSRLRRMFRRR